MIQRRMVNDSVQLYMHELTSRVVAQSGIPTDRYHIGKIILQSLKDAPDFVLQIDGATNESETCGSMLERSVRCAQSLRKLGLQQGDVMILIAPNHLDVSVPLYAALYHGIVVTSIARDMPIHEMQHMFTLTKPKIIFCQSDATPNVEITLSKLNINPHIITFDKSEDFCNMAEFMGNYADDTPTEDFRCTDIDTEESIAFLIVTSGSTGLPKAVAHTHKYIAIHLPYAWSQYNKFPTPTRLVFVVSALQWTSAVMSFIRSPILRYTQLQTSATLTQEHLFYLIKTFKPTSSVLCTTLMAELMKHYLRYKCDFTSFELLMVCGIPVPQTVIDEVKSVSPNTEVLNIYGMSELAGLAFLGDNPAPGSCGKPVGCYQYRVRKSTS